MADLLCIRARNGNGITWEWVDETMVGCDIELDQAPYPTIQDGDVWKVELVDTRKRGQSRTKRVAVVRLVSKVQELKPWEKLKSLPNYWIPEDDLRCFLVWLNSGTDVLLIGPKGSGKTTLATSVADTLGWQEPCKMDVYTIKRTTDLFGTDAAKQGSTHFVRSALLDYIERARIALEEGIDTRFIVILDEVNRVHAKANESMHGLFDDTRQVSIVTTEGSKTIKLPRNLGFVATMNMGSEYQGTYALDDALKDRFAPMKMKHMPLDYEVAKLTKETGVLESQSLAVVQVATALRDAATAGHISFAPSYRGCRNVARLVRHGMPIRTALIKGFLGWYEGELTLSASGEAATPNSEIAKAYSALRMKVTGTVKDALKNVSEISA